MLECGKNDPPQGPPTPTPPTAYAGAASAISRRRPADARRSSACVISIPVRARWLVATRRRCVGADLAWQNSVFRQRKPASLPLALLVMLLLLQLVFPSVRLPSQPLLLKLAVIVPLGCCVAQSLLALLLPVPLLLPV